MSGFLRRLAAGALHPQPAIHPSVGTIWSAAETMGRGTGAPAMEESIESTSEVLAPPPGRTDAEPSGAHPPQPDPHLHIPRMHPQGSIPFPDRKAHKHAMPPAIDEAAAFSPLVANPERRDVFTPPQANSAAQSNPGILPPHGISPVGAGSQSPRRTEFTTPLVPAPRMPVPAISAVRTAPAFLPPSQRPAQPAPSHAEERDAIEIHIGRIEVLAAPPRPAQPAAPGGARKSLDLGEYLRRERRPR
jgi:hypothetical protein